MAADCAGGAGRRRRRSCVNAHMVSRRDHTHAFLPADNQIIWHPCATACAGDMAQQMGNTRSAAALTVAAASGGGFGGHRNRRRRLLSLLIMLEDPDCPQPCRIIVFPVGFVGAA